MTDTAIATETRESFEQLKNDWKAKSCYMSNSAQMAMLWPYQQIIGIGKPALPLILQELAKETDHWFWALEAISGENPVPRDKAGDVDAMKQAWLEWGRRQGLIGHAAK